MCFACPGLAKPGDELAIAGNPMFCQTVQDHVNVEVIERRQHSVRQRAHNATQVSIEILLRPLQHLYSSPKHNRLERLRCVRDTCMVALVWQQPPWGGFASSNERSHGQRPVVDAVLSKRLICRPTCWNSDHRDGVL